MALSLVGGGGGVAVADEVAGVVATVSLLGGVGATALGFARVLMVAVLAVVFAILGGVGGYPCLIAHAFGLTTCHCR